MIMTVTLGLTSRSTLTIKPLRPESNVRRHSGIFTVCFEQISLISSVFTVDFEDYFSHEMVETFYCSKISKFKKYTHNEQP